MSGSLSLSGGLAGLAFGFGLWLVALRVPWARRTTLEDRLAPYLRDTPRPSSLLTPNPPLRTPFPVLERLLAPVMADAVRMLDRAFGGSASAWRRLERAGREPDVDSFRAEQVIWAVGAGGLAAVLAGLLYASGRTGPLLSVVVLVGGALAGVVACDQTLSRQARRREERILAEFPATAELLALAVAAGEGAVGALERVCRFDGGELAGELRRCLADARAGASLPQALQQLGDRTGLPSLARFVDGVVIAVERGTPLADVLRAQAQDVRETSRRALMEAGGKKEIAMMVPVVFLVLPVTILFAVYPGIAYLSFTV